LASRAIRSLMVALGIISAPSVGLNALQRPHCVQHTMLAGHKGHSSPSSAVPHAHDGMWTEAQDHRCPHCPASDCARIAPCMGSATVAVIPKRVEVPSVQSHRARVALARDHAYSAISPPDTRPPQLIV